MHLLGLSHAVGRVVGALARRARVAADAPAPQRRDARVPSRSAVAMAAVASSGCQLECLGVAHDGLRAVHDDVEPFGHRVELFGIERRDEHLLQHLQRGSCDVPGRRRARRHARHAASASSPAPTMRRTLASRRPSRSIWVEESSRRSGSPDRNHGNRTDPIASASRVSTGHARGSSQRRRRGCEHGAPAARLTGNEAAHTIAMRRTDDQWM